MPENKDRKFNRSESRPMGGYTGGPCKPMQQVFVYDDGSEEHDHYWVADENGHLLNGVKVTHNAISVVKAADTENQSRHLQAEASGEDGLYAGVPTPPNPPENNLAADVEHGVDGEDAPPPPQPIPRDRPPRGRRGPMSR